MPRLFISWAFMPTLCHYLNCRNRVNTLSKNLFCTEHFHENPVSLCNHIGTPLFRGLCRNCFITNFPKDPLTFQIIYKSKTDALKFFLFSHFDGFIEKSYGLYCLSINNASIFIFTDNNIIIDVPNSIKIYANFSKIIKPDGTTINPMLWKRLNAIYSIVNQEIENIVLNKVTPKFVDIGYHLSSTTVQHKHQP